MDMHSGGGAKEDFEYLYIEASEEEAKVIFYNRFRHNPDRVTCTCCGPDYSISEEDDLAQLTAYDRGCRYDLTLGTYVEEPDTQYSRDYVSLEEFLKRGTTSDGIRRGETFKIIRADEILPEERVGYVPEQGYVWHD